jgi:tetratricopeptide (TPR) repeat protein
MMRLMVLLAAGSALGSPAIAADQLKFGPAPAWVVPQAVPGKSTSGAEAPVALLMSDRQVMFEPGKTVSFNEVAMKIQTSQGLSAGNLSMPWQPSTDTVTVNKLHIIRDGKVIDVLGSGQTFTVLRRETNLEAATLDGTLTATIQPEGLQVGDIIDFATTDEHVDPVFKDHVEASYGSWNGFPLEFGHVKLSWPKSMNLVFRQTPSLPKPKLSTEGGRQILELSAHALEPQVPPASAPARFLVGRLGEATDFGSWSDLSGLMQPLYEKAAVIPASGPLRDELETIRKNARTPKKKTEKALELVEQRIRYVALLMDSGGYLPASAETTWSRRYGDCKGKTVLLLALLHELGIQAEPVLVHHSLGDILPERLPMISYFDHVIVRAHIGGKNYWLDGTRNGDSDLDRIPVPNFEWGLPLIANSNLAAITPKPLAEPQVDTAIDIDASAGAYAPAAFSVEQTVRGDDATTLKTLYSQLSPAQLDAALKGYWRNKYNYVDIVSVGWTFDDATATGKLSMAGSAKLNWDGGYYVPSSSVAFNPDFSRAEGPFHDAPFALAFPDWETAHINVKLPASFAGRQKKMPQPVDEVQAGTQYQRTIRINGSTVSVETSERTLQSELAYKDGIAAEPRLKALYDDDVYLRVPDDYAPNAADLAGLAARKPASASDYIHRGYIYLNAGKYDQAAADFTDALRLEPNNVTARADRGLAYVWARKFAEADKDFAAAEKIDSDDAVLLRGRGLLAEFSGNFQLAADSFTKSLESDPNNEFAQLNRAIAYASLWKFDDALRDLNPMIARNPNNAVALAQRAWIYTQQNKLDAAQKDVLAALAINPTSPQVLRAKAALAQQRGDQTGTIAALTAAVQASSGDPDSLVRRAQAYHRAGEDEKALADTEAAAKLGTMPAEGRLLRANIFRLRGKHDLVIREAELLEKENPASDFALVAAGKIFSAEGQREKALDAIDRALGIRPLAYIYVNRSQIREPTDYSGRMADLNEALKLDPNATDALALKAEMLVHQKRYAEALEEYDKAIASEPGDKMGLRQMRAVALYKSGKTTEAEKEFAEVRAQAKEPVDFNNLCWSMATADILLESALQDCRQAVKLRPDAGNYQDSLGMALLRLNRLDEAVKAYSEALEKAHLPASYMGRALAYAFKGDMVHAKADRAEALKLDPDLEAEFAKFGLNFPSVKPAN